HVSPPDQTWIPGLYDNADHDDAVLAIIASLASLDHRKPHDAPQVDSFVLLVAVIDESLHATPSPSSNPTRPPPAPQPLSFRMPRRVRGRTVARATMSVCLSVHDRSRKGEDHG